MSELGAARQAIMESNVTAQQLSAPRATRVDPGAFEPSRHFYPRALNAQVHPLVGYFMGMSMERVVSRYCHLHPRVDAAELIGILSYDARYLRWAGSDLFHVTTDQGVRKMA